jgi:hypothetical protein
MGAERAIKTKERDMMHNMAGDADGAVATSLGANGVKKKRSAQHRTLAQVEKVSVGGANLGRGSCMERENLHGDAKGKTQEAKIARPKVPMHRRGADCSVVVMKRSNARGAKGAGHRHWIGSTEREEPDNQWKAVAFVRWHEPDNARVSRPDL